MKRLTLLLIVKDAADLLPEFLTHHRGLAADGVMVDTGSSDATAELAAAAGLHVVRHRWGDDFAAARNAGLEAVSGDWVLILDADERISRTDFAVLREACETTEPVAFLQETHNYCAADAHREWRPVTGRYPAEEAGQTGYFAARRIGCFPADRGLRFRGRVHESVLPAVEKAGLPVQPLAVPVHHYGFVRSEAVNAARRATYRGLLELKLNDDPADTSARLEWATALLEDGETAAARVHLEALATAPPVRRAVVRGRHLLAHLRLNEGQVETAAELLEEVCTHEPGFLFGWLDLIHLRAGQEQWSEVHRLLRRAQAVLGRDDPLLMRAELRAAVKTGRLSAAHELATQLAERFPTWSEIAQLRRLLERTAPPVD